MRLRLVRDLLAPEFTLGRLYADDEFICHTCEDTDRFLEDGGEKIHGRTAIPLGLFKVRLSWSARFDKLLPELLDVSKFSGIRIHGGNHADDTLGCILVGSFRRDDGVAGSGSPMRYIKELIADCERRGEPVEIEITRAATRAIA